MKKIIAIALSATMTVGIMNVPAYAELTGFKGIGQISVKAETEELTYGDFKYIAESNGGITIKKYTGTNSVVTVPNTINGKDVLKIGERAFYNCSDLKQIKLPSKLESLGGRAFEGTGITSITIPKTLKNASSNAGGALAGAKNLKEVIIEEGMEKIPPSMASVEEDNQIQKLQIPSSVKEIGDNAFRNCLHLTEISFGKELKRIGQKTFLGCKGLKKISFSDNEDADCELTIGGYAFSGCTNLEEVRLSENVRVIDHRAFYNCSSLKQIKLPLKLKSMIGRVFEGTGITSITIPKTLESASSIDGGALAGAKNLKEVIIEEGMEKIPPSMLSVEEDNQIQKVQIPTSVKEIGDYAFRNCLHLTEISFGKGLKRVGEKAFWGCKGLKKISFSDNEDTDCELTIGGYAFSGCTNLEEVRLSENVRAIYQEAFYNCSSLKQIKLASKLKYMGGRVFEGTGITSITIPKTLESASSIHGGALAGAKKLKEVIIEEGMGKIPSSLVYVDADNQIQKIQIPSSVKEVGSSVFKNCKNFTIYSYKNSYAETYASENNIPFVQIGIMERPALVLDDYDKYQANYLSQNASMQTSTSMIYSEIENSYTPTKYALVNMLSLAWNSKFKYADDSEIWETILIDAMLRKSYDKQASDDFLKESAKMEVKLLKFIDDEQNIKQTDALTEASKKKISDTLKEAKVEDVDIMNGMLDAAEITKDFVDKYTKYLELKSIISTDTTAFLKELKTTQNYKEIPAFQRAVDRVVECMDTNGDDMLAKIGQIVLKNKVESKLFTESFNSTMEKLIDVAMPGLSKVVNLTKDPTIYLMDTICGTGNLAEVNIYLYMIDRIDEAAKEAYTNCTARNIASNGEEKIQAVNGGYRFLIDLSTYGIGISRKWNYYISKNLLSKRISDKLNTVKRPLRDIVSGMLNLNKESTINEEKQYVLKRCSENDKYINAMKNLTAFARVNWYEDTGSDKNGDRALLLFIVKNPDGTTSVTAEVKAKNAKIQYPKVEDKSGYTTPTNWYTNEKCTQTAPANLTVSKNQIFYTEYYAEGEYEVKASEGIKICKIYKAGQSRNASAKSARKIVDKTKCEIPSYIDGYKVTELGEDIFSELPDMTEIYIPTTVKTINKDAFKSLPKETLYRCDKKSYAEDFLHDNKYKNVRVEDNTPKPKTVKVSQIKLTGISNKIAAGKKIKLTATINPKNATKKTLKWTTNNKKLATVDKNGVVTINKKAGGKTVKITAEATDGSKKKATFTIKIMKGVVKKVKISGSKTVKSGKTLKLKAKVTASKGANKSLKWTSSNTKYATVTSSGKVKALKAGKKKTVKITAMAVDGSGKKATFKVKIK
ncbi:leucine-rich repeat protein [Anaerostipes sp.]|uniref:leucine-rich repeat protein n=1 Tax=Anaerostipes sp. TaxID=1872530 RepID=UPI003967DBCE